jgi:periplasmic copper chaperone A
MPRTLRTLLAAVVLVAVPLAGCGDDTGRVDAQGALRVVDATVAVPPNPDVAAVRFVIDNPTREADELVGATSEVADVVEIHRSGTDDEGRVTMDRLEALAVPQRSTVTFAPGGLHLMLRGIHEPLDAGSTIEVVLTFDAAGERTVPVQVLETGATPDDPEHDHDGD